jgi:hypothetical protein
LLFYLPEQALYCVVLWNKTEVLLGTFWGTYLGAVWELGDPLGVQGEQSRWWRYNCRRRFILANQWGPSQKYTYELLIYPHLINSTNNAISVSMILDRKCTLQPACLSLFIHLGVLHFQYSFASRFQYYKGY